jgi:hypothetical protein
VPAKEYRTLQRFLERLRENALLPRSLVTSK